jgi:hypothetical protein
MDRTEGDSSQRLYLREPGSVAAILALVAGLGFVSYTMLIQQLVVVAFLMLTAGAWLAVVHQRGEAVVGIGVALMTWGMLFSERARVPWSEEQAWMDGWVLYALWVVAAVGYWAGTKMQEDLRPGVCRASAAMALPGALALVATVAAALLYPTGQSYTMQLAPGWTRLPSQVYWYQMWPYGTDLTAQYGATADPDRTNAPGYPTIGLSVVGGRPGQTGADCFQMLWGTEMQVGDPDANPNPDAYYVTGQDESGTSYHAFTLARTRFVGVMTENLCYLVVFTLPRGSPITETDVSAIFATFRFR